MKNSVIEGSSSNYLKSRRFFSISYCYLPFTIRKEKVHVSKSSESFKYFPLTYFTVLHILFALTTCFTALHILIPFYFTGLSLSENRCFMYDTTIKLEVSHMCHQQNLLFCLNSIFYRIKLYVTQALGKNNIIFPY